MGVLTDGDIRRAMPVFGFDDKITDNKRNFIHVNEVVPASPSSSC